MKTEMYQQFIIIFFSMKFNEDLSGGYLILCI
jgi:hypothetical protein